MEYSINKQELQKISYQFRTLSSRLLRTDFQSAIDNLKRLLSYINETPLIKKFIDDNSVIEFDIPAEISIAKSERRGHFNIPINKCEEISFTYQLLSYAAEHHNDYYELSSGYSFGRKYQDQTDEFNKVVVNPFINHITQYFEEIMIDAGMFENSSKIFHFNGPNMGQINVSQDTSTLNAFMTINPSIDEIGKLANQILNTINQESISASHRETIQVAVESINEQLSSSNPKKGYLKLFIETLKNTVSGITATSVFIDNITKLIDKVQTLMSTLP